MKNKHLIFKVKNNKVKNYNNNKKWYKNYKNKKNSKNLKIISKVQRYKKMLKFPQILSISLQLKI